MLKSIKLLLLLDDLFLFLLCSTMVLSTNCFFYEIKKKPKLIKRTEDITSAEKDCSLIIVAASIIEWFQVLSNGLSV